MKNSAISKGFFRIAAGDLFKIVLLPVLLLGLAVCAVNSYGFHEEINRSSENAMRYATEHINRVTNDLQRLNQSLTTNPAVTLSLKTAMWHAAEGKLQGDEFAVCNAIIDLVCASDSQNEYIESIYIYFEDGKDYFISSQKRLTSLLTNEDTGWYDSYLRSDTFSRTWKEMRLLEDGNGETRRILTIYSRIFAGGVGSDRGVLVLNIDCEKLDNLFNNLQNEWNSSICVMDDQGNIIFANDECGRAFAGYSIEGLLREQAGEDWRFMHQIDVSHNGERYIGYTQQMTSENWQIVFLSPQSALYAAPRKVSIILLFMLLSALIFGVYYAYLLAKRNSEDIRHVMDSIQQARRGQKISHSAKDSNTYSDMLQSVVDTFLEKDYLEVYQAEREHHVKLMELQALQSQLNPHFLYNTMSTIQWKTIGLTNGRNAVSDMIENLSDLLHYVLDSGTELAMLTEELEVTNSYVAIQKIRYADRFSYQVHCGEELGDIRVMKMLLQPLVENSISHGMNSEGTLHVQVHITREDDVVCIRVRDDGQGMDDERLEYVRKSLDAKRTENGKHIGLYNVNKRIVLTYGPQYAIRIDSQRGEGTCINLRLPLMTGVPGSETDNGTGVRDAK